MAKIIYQNGAVKIHHNVKDENLKEVVGMIGLSIIETLIPRYKNWTVFIEKKMVGYSATITADMSVTDTQAQVGYYTGMIAETMYEELK